MKHIGKAALLLAAVMALSGCGEESNTPDKKTDNGTTTTAASASADGQAGDAQTTKAGETPAENTTAAKTEETTTTAATTTTTLTTTADSTTTASIEETTTTTAAPIKLEYPVELKAPINSSMGTACYAIPLDNGNIIVGYGELFRDHRPRKINGYILYGTDGTIKKEFDFFMHDITRISEDRYLISCSEGCKNDSLIDGQGNTLKAFNTDCTIMGYNNKYIVIYQDGELIALDMNGNEVAKIENSMRQSSISHTLAFAIDWKSATPVYNTNLVYIRYESNAGITNSLWDLDKNERGDLGYSWSSLPYESIITAAWQTNKGIYISGIYDNNYKVSGPNDKIVTGSYIEYKDKIITSVDNMLLTVYDEDLNELFTLDGVYYSGVFDGGHIWVSSNDGYAVLDTSGNVVFKSPENAILVPEYNPRNGMYAYWTAENLICCNADGELMFIIN